MDLLAAFHPTTVYTCSDEITMIFPVLADEDAAATAEDEDGAPEAEVADGQTGSSIPTDKKERVLPYNGKGSCFFFFLKKKSFFSIAMRMADADDLVI
jgi:hypothetical protein